MWAGVRSLGVAATHLDTGSREKGNNSKDNKKQQNRRAAVLCPLDHITDRHENLANQGWQGGKVAAFKQQFIPYFIDSEMPLFSHF